MDLIQILKRKLDKYFYFWNYSFSFFLENFIGRYKKKDRFNAIKILYKKLFSFFLNQNKIYFSYLLKAFSLIEVAFSLLLFGFFLSVFFSIYKYQNQNFDRSVTKMRANYVRRALQGYVATYGFLPYAAKDLSGIESEGCGIGFLPYKTLGISKDYAFDGYQRPFIFFVNENLVLKFIEKNGWRIFPPFFPVAFFVPGLKSWNRLFSYKSFKTNDIVTSFHLGDWVIPWDYDDIDVAVNLIIKKKGVPLILRTINIFPMFNYDLLQMQNRKNFININEWKNCYVIQDLFAWGLISHSKKIELESFKRPISIELNAYDFVFWQSRFNLAALIGTPMSTLGVYFGSIKAEKNFFKFMC